MTKTRYCNYYTNPNAKIPRKTKWRLKNKERIERLAKDYVILTNKGSEAIFETPLMISEDMAFSSQGLYEILFKKYKI